jgi:heme oxygenase (biliverdin-IX-beta and delta-forming)
MLELTQFDDAGSQALGRCGQGLRLRLRSFTHDSHRALDRELTSFDLTRTSGYRRFLQVTAAALVPLEAALSRAGVSYMLADWGQRSRCEAILKDLAAIGGKMQPLPFEGSLNVSQAWGVMYVLEGSRLGAKVLLRGVADLPHARGATAYLRHGLRERLWQSFVVLLESRPCDPADEVDVMDGARLAFDHFTQAARAP